MSLRFLRAYWLLIRIDLTMLGGRFHNLHTLVKSWPVRDKRARAASPESLCHAADIACVLYPKQVLCLQRSVVTTLSLRQEGWPAELIIGAQLLPFRSHAWVELDGRVINDKPYMSEMYQVLERC